MAGKFTELDIWRTPNVPRPELTVLSYINHHGRLRPVHQGSQLLDIQPVADLNRWSGFVPAVHATCKEAAQPVINDAYQLPYHGIASREIL